MKSWKRYKTQAEVWTDTMMSELCKALISVALLGLLAGCANTMTGDQRAQLQSDRVASASKPMLTLECASGCQFEKLELRDPRAVASLPAIQTPTNGWDLANTLVNAATSVAPWVAVTKISTDAVDALADREDNTTITRTNETTERGDTAGGDIAGGDQRGDTRGDVRGDVAGDTRGDVRGDVSGDTRGDVRGDTAGRDQIGGDSSTSDPTVVTQPDPTVVDPNQ